MSKMTRRKFLRISALAMPALVGVDAVLVERTALRVTKLNVNGAGKCRFVHFTDFHHKGDLRYAAEVIRAINDLNPEFVCFTGDLVEDRHFAAEALGFIRQIKAPVYGCPGNHEYSSHVSFQDYEDAFGATGGSAIMKRQAAHCMSMPGSAPIVFHCDLIAGPKLRW